MIKTSAEVATALQDGRPVVALESTIIAHGLPRPRNLAVAVELEDRLREQGVTPATIGVVHGMPTVGLDARELKIMAESDDVEKASVRDLPVIGARGGHAATTVASTALLARRAGIRVFATGGLGGVHRGAAYDESNDLLTLSRSRLVVVCAGVKSILDVPATLERMETLGITVLGYRTAAFPGFYVSDSGHPVDHRVDDAEAVALVLKYQEELDGTGAIVVANPVDPAEQLDPDLHDRVLGDALAAADTAGVQGKPVTPFLLEHMRELTGGKSLEANIAAVRGNVRLAAEIARAL